VKQSSTYRITSEGWVYIRDSRGTWRPVTSHYFWDNNWGAQIVCEDLGYGKGVRTRTRNPHNRELFDTKVGYRRCSASSKNIFQCRKHGGPNQKDLSAVANVKCSGKPWKPVYVKTGSEFRITTEGWVYRRGKDGQWRPLTSHYFWDNKYGARIVCENLGYGQGSTQKGKRNQNNRELFDSETGYRRCHAGNTHIL
jgi:hypothetical protein